MTKIHLIAAARPNFMKIAPLYHEMKKHPWLTPVIIHTGQHYDYNMSEAFFRDLALPAPDVNLEVGSGSHSQQTAEVMIAYEKYLLANKPDLVVVVGDVNSTMACTITAKKLNFQVAHLEAGLRSYDRIMPEEINRIVTDALADILWTPSYDADDNLIAEGIDRSKISYVGNIMIDSLLMMKDKIDVQNSWEKFSLIPNNYSIVTIHRPSNTDCEHQLKRIVHCILTLSQNLPIFLPLHPRTKKKLLSIGLMEQIKKSENIILSDPLAYIEFMALLQQARLVITDSGGLQEETTFMNIPCLTLRDNTERPITCSQGTNELVSLDNLPHFYQKALNGDWKIAKTPDKWDGNTAQRIVQDIKTRTKSMAL
jgi:UDP-N-acetylglucosamine 2-epimerase (non-hydrolysing)